MRLKKLILHGFKSFADRTEFDFLQPITGIVGPNGCGKSNVVDGFKWVLGEQSAKSLRGEAMLDVIFNGSGGRKPAGMAEVTLVFENPKRENGSRLLNIDTDEVAVGRRLFRDGTSEYQINNQGARLKDIRELFLDTGVGVDAYSVIEQGKVDLLLQSNPQERRLIFEEAAGISKYKAKKKEAQRKLEKVDQNLLRLNDIVEEVQKRLRSVKVQAGRARTFQEHTLRLRELRLNYALQEYHGLHQQTAQLTASEQETRAKLDEVFGQLSQKQNELAENRRQYDELSQLKQRAEYELVQTAAGIQSAQQRQQYAAQQLAQIAEQLAQFEQDRAAVAAKSGEVAGSLEGESANLAKLTEDVSAHRQQIEEAQRAFADGQLQLNQVNRLSEQHKAAVLDLMRRGAGVNNRLGAIEIERKNLASQESRLGERRRVVMEEVAALETVRSEIEQQHAAAVAEITDLQAKLEASAAEAAALGRQIAQISQQLGAAREHRSAMVSRQRLLQDLENKREGVSEGVKAMLRQRAEKFPFVRGLVADLLRVDVEHAQVIEAALDGRDQMVVTENTDAATAADESLQELEGRVNLLCADRLPPFHDGYDWNQHPQPIRLAVDLVRFEPQDGPVARHLLGHTVTTDNLDDAMELSRNGPRGYRYVTKAGEVVEADGILRAGPLTAAMGLLSRRSELEAIAMQIAEVDRRIEHLSTQLSEGNAQVKALQETQNAIRNSFYQANTKKVELASKLAQNQDKQAVLRREMPLLEKEIQNLADQATRLRTEETGLAEKRQAIEAEQASRQQQIEELAAKQAELNQSLKTSAEQLTNLRVVLGQVQEKQLAAQQAVRRLEAAKAELAQQLERIVRSAEQVAGRRASVESERSAAAQSEQELTAKQQTLTEQEKTLAEQVTAVGQSVAELTRRVDSIRGEHGEIEQSLHQMQLQLGELRVRSEGLVQRTLEELQLDLPARYTELNSAEGGYKPADIDWNGVADEIKQLREKIQRLGNVNLDAINELDELEKREQFLSTQVNDLVQSKQQLEELIDAINKESSLRFEQTFAAVREHFQGMFRKLFGGGKADIFLETELEGSEVRVQGSAEAAKPDSGLNPEPGTLNPPARIDPLDAGIEIIARPPGKQPVSISQLSGGEKTMTCVALLLSIFKSKPSPFCILDEVDAALDEANNQRFNLIVQEFLEQSHFIVITHSKRTMQIADVLYGVTMQEQGVSKRVAVKFDQVDGQGRIAEQAAA